MNNKIIALVAPTLILATWFAIGFMINNELPDFIRPVIMLAGFILGVLVVSLGIWIWNR